MYLPKHFEQNDPAALHALIRDEPLGLLVTMNEAGAMQANSIPFLLDADPAGGPGILCAHVARANPVWRETNVGVEALVVFQGPQAYISPGWYPSKAEHGKAVPTWNYAIVQGRGRLRAIDDAEWLRAFVTRVTVKHETTQAQPWAVADAPPDFIDTMLRAIVGIEITLTALTGKWKVSQNRPVADRAGVIAALDAGGHGDSARLVPR